VDRDHVLAGIKADSDALLQRLREAPEGAFALPTPCAAWDVAHLVAHLHRDFERVGWALASATDEPPDHDRVTYWHYDRAENQARTQERARGAVERFGTPAALVDALDAMVAEALDLSAGAAAPLVVRLTWGPVIDFDEFLATRWLELVVHSLDLTTALGQDDCVSADGLSVVVDILDRLAGRPVSAEAAPWRAAARQATSEVEAGGRAGPGGKEWVAGAAGAASSAAGVVEAGGHRGPGGERRVGVPGQRAGGDGIASGGAGGGERRSGAAAFIRMATGRAPLTAEARARLGADMAERFPLLA
jgi:uncharacterized protein (TIGR03083 family)